MSPGSKLSVSGGGSFGAGYGTTAAPTGGLIIEGNVGIGTTSPTSLLHLLGSQPASVATAGTAATQALQITGGKGGNTTGTTGQTAGLGAIVNITGGAGGDAPSGSTNANGGSITLQGGAAGAGLGNAGVCGNVLLATAGGNVGIGTANPSTDELVVVGDSRIGTSGTNGCIEQFNGVPLVGACSSDINLKKNILPLTNILDKFIQFQPVTYQWRTDEFPERHFGTELIKGLIAQEVEKLFPELVGMDVRGFKTVNYGIAFQMMSIEAIKELNSVSVKASASGNVGIGTATPQEKLALGSGSNLATEMSAPTGVSAVSVANSGSCTAGAYYYKVVAVDGAGGTTIGSTEVSDSIASTGSTNISWSAVTGAASYRVYGRTSGMQSMYLETTNTTLQDGCVNGTAGSVPTVTTAYVNKFTASGNSWISGGNFGIGTANPGVLLDLGLAGTTSGVIRLAGSTSGNVIIQPAAVAGAWTMTLPTTAGTAGQQLTTDGNGVTTWAVAGSLRSMKDIISTVTDPSEVLTQILSTPIYRFHYKTGMGTGDTQTEYVGVMADEALWAMHYNGTVINPVNTLGYMVLGIQATNKKITDLSTIVADNVVKQATVNETLLASIKELNLQISNLSKGQIASPISTLVDYGQYASLFFSDVLVKVENGVAYMKNLAVETLKIGNPDKRTGITFYDEVTGNPNCFSIANGITKTILGECTTIIPPPTNINSDNLAASINSGSSTYSPANTDAPIITLDVTSW